MKTVTVSESESKVQMSTSSNNTASKTKILIVYYSTWGHIKQLVDSEAKGVSSVSSDIEVRIAQFPETLPAELLKQLYAAPRDSNHPTVTHEDLKWADGILIGIPTRFGTAPAQFKAFWDGTGGLWQKGELFGKLVGLFFSTGSQAGGQETTVLTTLPNFAHHGMVFVPQGFPDPSQFNMDEIHGGSAWGAGTYAGATGSRQPTKLELNLAEVQGKNFAKFARVVKAGRDATAAQK